MPTRLVSFTDEVFGVYSVVLFFTRRLCAVVRVLLTLSYCMIRLFLLTLNAKYNLQHLI